MISEIASLRAERDRLVTMLADCYRFTGADPDSNDDRTLAEYAVNAVKELRADVDFLWRKVDALEGATKRPRADMVD